jgi:hypothetical protein
MYHTIEFATEVPVALAWSPGDRLRRLSFRVGDRFPAEVRPYVVETAEGPLEVADLLLADGTAIHGVPFACFCFID